MVIQGLGLKDLFTIDYNDKRVGIKDVDLEWERFDQISVDRWFRLGFQCGYKPTPFSVSG